MSTELMGLEEEEFTTRFNGRTLLRILKLLSPYKWRVAGFVLSVGIVSALDSVFTWLSMLLIDEGIIPGDRARMFEVVRLYYGLLLIQAAMREGLLGTP